MHRAAQLLGIDVGLTDQPRRLLFGNSQRILELGAESAVCGASGLFQLGLKFGDGRGKPLDLLGRLGLVAVGFDDLAAQVLECAVDLFAVIAAHYGAERFVVSCHGALLLLVKLAADDRPISAIGRRIHKWPERSEFSVKGTIQKTRADAAAGIRFPRTQETIRQLSGSSANLESPACCHYGSLKQLIPVSPPHNAGFATAVFDQLRSADPARQHERSM